MAPTRFPLLTALLIRQNRSRPRGDDDRTFATCYPVLAEMLLADFKTAQKKFADGGVEVEEIKKYFEEFKALKPRIKEADERDIDKWAKQGWEKFKSFVDELKGTKSGQQLKKEEKAEGAEMVAENDDWRVYHIVTHKACMMYGSNTKWCITQQNGTHWKNYTKAGNNFYFILSKTKRESPWNKIALAVDKKGDKSYFDEQDKHHSELPKEFHVPEFDVKVGPNLVINGRAYTDKQFEAAEGLVVNGDLDLRENHSALPKNLTVKGTLRCNPDTTQLPEGLKVGSLMLLRCEIKSLPYDIQITTELNAEFSSLVSIVPLKLKGDLTISDTIIAHLPGGMVIGGDLDIMTTEITELPDDLKVGGAIFVDDPESNEIEMSDRLKELVC